mmetsp:Transcript_741/g.1341  ORF Transcript_741/g.1341 Transcript_741/m.1341 type:complete len:253 (+) Transcript_741:141-899(+)|eukprot:CAMPEP_0183713594 /NCGR_PEP_ID=MMETSP0737-20130205/8395_1 /TAXON_ID=385413 /ORGANISM="Thalassiosira miniscula, Strain CCMP1093" /LENGTH=252 /DNA_ID=CAMNT_0025942397 /DNA_START=91 /DNA_END=849 /DNA_ORIENTATION=-
MADDDAGAMEIEDGGASSGSTVKKSKRLGKVSSHTPMEILSGAAAFVSVGTSVTAMVMSFNTLVLVSGVFTSLIGPYSYYQQTKLTDIIALKEAHEAVRREVDRLAGENIRLNEKVGDLSETMDKLEDVEQALDVITQTQGQSVATFKEQVKENRDIWNQLQKQLRANVLQNLLQVVIRSDQNDDMQIEEYEINPLIERIKKINGVEVREDRFRERIISSGGSLQSVMDIIKTLMADESGGEDGIFVIKGVK